MITEVRNLIKIHSKSIFSDSFSETMVGLTALCKCIDTCINTAWFMVYMLETYTAVIQFTSTFYW